MEITKKASKINVDMQLATAFKYLNDKKYKEALKRFNEVKKYIDKTHPNIISSLYYGMSHAYLELNNLDNSIRYIEKAIAIDVKPEFYALKCVILREMNQYKEAFENINKAISMDSKNGWFFFYRGLLNFDKKNWKNAAADFEKSIELGDGSADSFNNLGFACLNLGKIEKAEKAFDMAITIDMNKVEPYIGKCNVLSLQSRYDEIKKVVKAARKIGLDHPALNFFNAQSLYISGKKADAGAELLRVAGVSASFDSSVIKMLMNIKDYKTIARIYDKWREKNQTIPVFYELEIKALKKTVEESESIELIGLSKKLRTLSKEYRKLLRNIRSGNIDT